ncbi:MAG: site-2 protease family protein [Phycisphaerales bacterium]
MSEAKSVLRKERIVFWILVVALALYLVARNIGAFTTWFKVLLGFGAMIIVHEFGHFIAAKLLGIKVEGFSIGFPPTLLGILRTENGFRIRILPRTTEEGVEPSQACSFTVGGKCKAGETEYRIGLIPFGGYVKMLGQEDIGEVKATNDPRSYANKPVSSRMVVIAAGVVFNALSAVILFMAAFLVGIELPPAQVGDVIPGSPAALANLEAGDEIIEVDGKNKNLDFSNIGIAAALSGENEAIKLKVRRRSGSIEQLSLVAERVPGSGMKVFGIEQPFSLKIAELTINDAKRLRAQTGLQPGDRVISVNGQDVQHLWQLEEIAAESFKPQLSLLVERKAEGEEAELVESEIPVRLSFSDSYEIETESELHHVCSMVPRLRIESVSKPRVCLPERIVALFDRMVGAESESRAGPALKEGDVILSAGGVDNPTYYELREVVTAHEGKDLAITVLRADANGIEQMMDINVRPRLQDERVVIGVRVMLDAEHPVVAKTIPFEGEAEGLVIPRGATITKVNGEAVENFFQIIELIRQKSSGDVKIEYRFGEGKSKNVVFRGDDPEGLITTRPMPGEFIPFAPLEKLYRADGPVEAVVIGFRKTGMFIAQTYATLSSLIHRDVSAKELMGPLGILYLSYQVADTQPPIYHVYLIGLMSACIAVFNFLPLPPLDGGHVVFLLIEKLKGSALNFKIQAAVIYAGWTLIAALFIYVTFNDILRIFRGLFF